MSPELPTSLLGLFIAIVVGQSALLAWLVRGVKGDQGQIVQALATIAKSNSELVIEARTAGLSREALLPTFVALSTKVEMMSDKMLDVMLRLAEGANRSAEVAQTAQKQATTNGKP